MTSAPAGQPASAEPTSAEPPTIEQRLSKSELAYSTMRERILRSDYAPGERLVLGRIGAEIGASVVPVREAVRRLEAEGLVTFERNVGARVAEIDEAEYLDTMEAFSVVEGAAVAMAAPHVSLETLARARAVNARMRDLLDTLDPQEFTALNEQFHRLLTDSCPNQHLGEMVDRCWNHLSRLRRSTFTYVPERAAASVEEHEQILQLIGDASPAPVIEKAVREHRMATPSAFQHTRSH